MPPTDKVSVNDDTTQTQPADKAAPLVVIGQDPKVEMAAITSGRGGVPDGSNLIIGDGGYPSTRAGKLQEFADNFGPAGYLYGRAIDDQGRFGKFQERMGAVYENDRDAFLETGKLAKDIRDTNVPPEQIGQRLGGIIADAVDRQRRDGVIMPPDSPYNQQFYGALTGIMLGARSKFDQGTSPEQTKAMVDGLESELRKRNVDRVHGIIWGDNGEPGMAVTAPGQQIPNRHKFE
jgi:hypothetical protein